MSKKTKKKKARMRRSKANHGKRPNMGGLASGADSYVTKPYLPERLLARVSAAIAV